ncbi:MAG: NUDIX domain-containing protein [Candidatus Thorarchaeota archaeon]
MIHAADGILKDKDGEIVLIKRLNTPYQGSWALPGGMVEKDERVEEALVREMKEEVGVEVIPFEILGLFSDPGRDPRGRVISTVFICDYIGKLRVGSDAAELRKCTVSKALTMELAFDHHHILKCYEAWQQNRGTYWSLKKIGEISRRIG